MKDRAKTRIAFTPKFHAIASQGFSESPWFPPFVGPHKTETAKRPEGSRFEVTQL